MTTPARKSFETNSNNILAQEKSRPDVIEGAFLLRSPPRLNFFFLSEWRSVHAAEGLFWPEIAKLMIIPCNPVERFLILQRLNHQIPSLSPAPPLAEGWWGSFREWYSSPEPGGFHCDPE